MLIGFRCVFFMQLPLVSAFVRRKIKQKGKGECDLNREQYLRSRIAELAHTLAFDQSLPTAQRRNLERALLFYLEDLRNR